MIGVFKKSDLIQAEHTNRNLLPLYSTPCERIDGEINLPDPTSSEYKKTSNKDSNERVINSQGARLARENRTKTSNRKSRRRNCSQAHAHGITMKNPSKMYPVKRGIATWDYNMPKC
jgi:hypothetical protein